MGIIENNLKIVLVGTRFPENIGSAARASANFGHASITLVSPEMWDIKKALPLATRQGEPLLEHITIVDTLQEAIDDCTMTAATTARTGGWRREMLQPSSAAKMIAERITSGEKTAVVFGPEDRGLSNEDLLSCTNLITIPTDPKSRSLNISQAVLLIMYEIFLHSEEQQSLRSQRTDARHIRVDERDLLFKTITTTLTGIDFLPEENPSYFFMPLQRMLDRCALRRHEMDLLMGICRQIRNKTR